MTAILPRSPRPQGCHCGPMSLQCAHPFHTSFSIHSREKEVKNPPLPLSTTLLVAAKRVSCKIFQALANNKKIVVGLHHAPNAPSTVVAKPLPHLLHGRIARLCSPHTARVFRARNRPLSLPTGCPTLVPCGATEPQSHSTCHASDPPAWVWPGEAELQAGRVGNLA